MICLSCLIICLASAFTVIATGSYEVFERIHEVPEGWEELSAPVDNRTTLSMRIHLKKQNSEEFEDRFLKISDPDHEDYGNHLSREQVKLFLQPHHSSVDAVVTWLKQHGVGEDIAVDYDWVKLNITVAAAEELLQTKYKYYVYPDTKRRVIRTLAYSLPTELHDHVSIVQPTTMFGMRAMRSMIHRIRPAPPDEDDGADVMFRTTAAKVGVPKDQINVSVCNATMTPKCLSDLYGFTDYLTHGHGHIGVSGFVDQWPQYDDLEHFLTRYRPEAADRGNFSIVTVNGGENVQNAPYENIFEANLDVQYTLGLAFPINTTYYSTGGRPPHIPDLDHPENDSEPYLEYLDYLLAQETLPDVITTSYGENEQTVPYRYRLTVCDKFKELGARGVSVIFASGDSGPGWSCISNDGRNTTKFLPVFPASCPWVTAVGATARVLPEQAVEFSSGGFSETWRMPSYQYSTIRSYLRNHRNQWYPFRGYFNKYGRAFPDVAAQGDNFRVFLDGEQSLIDGTSASAPAFAGIISLVNDNRISQGKKPLGFLNPLLYKHPEAFTDIRKGRSFGCNGTQWRGEPIRGGPPKILRDAGWNAVQGWDPVTGLGTPKFEILKNL